MQEKNLKTNLKKIQKQVNPVIEEILSSQVSQKFRHLALHQIKTGGKRIRPVLATATCLGLGGKVKNVLDAAAGLEIIHNYTLIVDDIIDHSYFRRNKPTLWAEYGTSMAECASIWFASSVFQSANRSIKPRKITEIFSRVMKQITGGEIDDILFERHGRTEEKFIKEHRPKEISKRQCLSMMNRKTASLFEASCEAGAVCATTSKKLISTAKRYGHNLGMGFQIRDDILDIFGDEKKFGKQIGGDIKERKGGNIVILLAFEELNKKEKTHINALMKKNAITKKDIEGIMKLIKKTNALQKALKLSEYYIKKAKHNMEFLPKNKHTELLSGLADFTITRSA